MSFVGPRALDLNEQRSLEKLIPGFAKRLQVRPGLTGLAQIFDKVDDPYEKYRYDMEYLEKISPVLDARLLLHSVWNTAFARWDHRSGKIDLDNLIADDDNSTDDQPEFTEPTASDLEERGL
jgi:lipopolysaccharide/colanic/teichoic acid biosynthesis glycosyltransferase